MTWRLSPCKGRYAKHPCGVYPVWAGGKTRWLQDEPAGRMNKLRHRAGRTLRGLHRASTWRALNMSRYGAEARNLILSAICGQTAQPYRADVFIAHFGPAGVTAAKLRELG